MACSSLSRASGDKPGNHVWGQDRLPTGRATLLQRPNVLIIKQPFSSKDNASRRVPVPHRLRQVGNLHLRAWVRHRCLSNSQERQMCVGPTQVRVGRLRAHDTPDDARRREPRIALWASAAITGGDNFKKALMRVRPFPNLKLTLEAIRATPHCSCKNRRGCAW